MSLSLKFSEYKKHLNQNGQKITQDVLKSMTKEELSSERIAFGETKRGETFANAFKDTCWTQMIIGRFENKSSKPEHLTYLRFVELMLADMPATSLESPPQTEKKPKNQQTASAGEEWETVSLGMAEESLAMTQEALGEIRDLLQDLSHRVAALESQQSQILMHLQG